MTASATSLLPAARASALATSINAARAKTTRFIEKSPLSRSAGLQACPGPPDAALKGCATRGGPSDTIAVTTSQLRQPVGAVALRLLVNPVHVEHAQQQIPGRHRLALVGEVPVPFELSVGAADENMRDVVVLVLIRIPHVGAVHDQGVVEQRAVAVRRRLQLLGEVGERRNVVAVDVGVAPDLHRIFLMV